MVVYIHKVIYLIRRELLFVTSSRQSINLSAAEAQRAFELLDICKFKDILGNIIYLGLEETSKEVFKKVNKEKSK